MLLITIAVWWHMGRPVLFRQRRAGFHARPFELVKFRTMVDDGGTSDEERLTSLGRFLRRTSLDELPELFNVLRGDMSLVGPRPLLMDYLPRFNARQARRHEVKPGLTGWAQVNGRNRLNWEERLEADVWYVDHGSLVLDLKILWRTLVRVMKQDGISAPGHATMPEFRGSPE
jgi:lipopolysaccharide/colanic/teichoic acid biosynthesis glycosyltransferase